MTDRSRSLSLLHLGRGEGKKGKEEKSKIPKEKDRAVIKRVGCGCLPKS